MRETQSRIIRFMLLLAVHGWMRWSWWQTLRSPRRGRHALAAGGLHAYPRVTSSPSGPTPHAEGLGLPHPAQYRKPLSRYLASVDYFCAAASTFHAPPGRSRNQQPPDGKNTTSWMLVRVLLYDRIKSHLCDGSLLLLFVSSDTRHAAGSPAEHVLQDVLYSFRTRVTTHR